VSLLRARGRGSQRVRGFRLIKSRSLICGLLRILIEKALRTLWTAAGRISKVYKFNFRSRPNERQKAYGRTVRIGPVIELAKLSRIGLGMPAQKRGREDFP
jgi:hypothetical protein